ncbi:Mannosyl-glycoprotein endo-beta-N-acetylglucosaminidase [Sedimentisphaera cyanobacteriorum]|uniref:Mannosyl-glycoprotein endo-beta-N-acetylglucosaminidase n=1 Tax=Sedimentisphaera cyanobacteriorum TaxID=1940790 RepID=A0A1Q2HQL9_9BACT|nr:glucosaminidase domain-containing protein [Sedimentisphaera cyanobacteriorum]AQQ09749.1 Mannosyl-glycoprotein endo-beta-N-acetylglucosaminidase [Sedimentisphaera cyanobacteriorum]
MKTLKRRLIICSLCIASAVLLASCAGQPQRLAEADYTNRYLPIPIESAPKANARQLTAFFLASNPAANRERVSRLAQIYIEEAAEEGINSDIAFCQMVHETNYLRFGADVREEQNNFCGLGATGGGEPGHSFQTPRLGARAHIQHLKAYANSRPLRKTRIDPRFELVDRGSSPHIAGLTGTWATDPQYDRKLRRKLRDLESFL